MVAVFGGAPGTVLKFRNVGSEPPTVMVSVVLGSGSVAVAVIVGIGAFSVPVAVAGALMLGGVLPLEERAPSQSDQSPARPLVVPQGSSGSPTPYKFGKKK